MAQQEWLLICSNPGDDDGLIVKCENLDGALEEALFQIIFSDDYEEVKITTPDDRVILDHAAICEKLGIVTIEFTTDITNFLDVLF